MAARSSTLWRLTVVPVRRYTLGCHEYFKGTTKGGTAAKGVLDFSREPSRLIWMRATPASAALSRPRYSSSRWARATEGRDRRRSE
jgi:hypothetical protein